MLCNDAMVLSNGYIKIVTTESGFWKINSISFYNHFTKNATIYVYLDLDIIYLSEGIYVSCYVYYHMDRLCHAVQCTCADAIVQS